MLLNPVLALYLKLISFFFVFFAFFLRGRGSEASAEDWPMVLGIQDKDSIN